MRSPSTAVIPHGASEDCCAWQAPCTNGAPARRTPIAALRLFKPISPSPDVWGGEAGGLLLPERLLFIRVSRETIVETVPARSLEVGLAAAA